MSSATQHERASVTQEVVLREIQRYWDYHGISPSMRELAEITGYALATVQYHVCDLVLLGLIERRPGVPRSIKMARGSR